MFGVPAGSPRSGFAHMGWFCFGRPPQAIRSDGSGPALFRWGEGGSRSSFGLTSLHPHARARRAALFRLGNGVLGGLDRSKA